MWRSLSASQASADCFRAAPPSLPGKTGLITNGLQAGSLLNGKVTVNVLPTPTSLFTAITSSMASVKLFIIESPSPMPPNWDLSPPDSCRYFWKMGGSSSAGMPIPWSVTSTLNLSASAKQVTETTVRDGLYFKAIVIKLYTICVRYTFGRRSAAEINWH